MLKTKETKNINATSSVEQQIDGIVQSIMIANMSANIESDGRTSINAYICDQEVFEQNKETVVDDIITFVKNAYGVEVQ